MVGRSKVSLLYNSKVYNGGVPVDVEEQFGRWINDLLGEIYSNG